MTLAFLCFGYGLLLLVPILNLLFMKRPTGRTSSSEGPSLCVCIPARDEEENLQRLLPTLIEPNPGLKVYVFDDESSDRTAEVARLAGATVISPTETLPVGWTGKNRACHRLGQAAAEDSGAEWLLFLDADVRPAGDFIEGMRWLAVNAAQKDGVITGFPKVMPGKGIEPLFLGWVGWILLAANPFGLVSKSGMGHNRFTNGQIHMWRQSVYTDLWPNEQVKFAVLEDVMLGRLLAKEKIAVEVANLSSVLSVKMYETWRETLDGMSKNSFEITGSVWGSHAFAALMFTIGWLWLLAGRQFWIPLALLALSGFVVSIIARASFLLGVLMPIILTLGSFTIERSIVWRKKGTVVWKGRTYSS